MNWEEKVYENGICPINYHLNFDNQKKHYVSIGPSKYIENSWFIWYYQGGYTCIKETFEAKSVEEAKEKAIARIRNSINNTINYYQNLLNEVDKKV